MEPLFPRVKRPVTLAIAAIVVALQGVVVLVLAVIELVRTSPGNAGVAVTTALFFALVGAGLLVVGRGLAAVESWARGPVVAAELIELLTAYSFLGGDTTATAIALAVVAVGVLVCVLHPTSTAALADDPAD